MNENRNRIRFEDEMDDEDDDSLKDKYLTFHLGDEDYGIDVANVVEIVGFMPVTDVPDLPSYIRGVINLRGSVIPAIDMRLRFGMPERDYDARTCVIVVNVGSTSAGLIVDTVSEVLVIPSGNVSPPPNIDDRPNRFVRGIGRTGNKVKLLLNLDAIFEKRGMF